MLTTVPPIVATRGTVPPVVGLGAAPSTAATVPPVVVLDEPDTETVPDQ